MKMYTGLFILGIELVLSTSLVHHYIKQRRDTQKAQKYFDEVVRKCDEELKHRNKKGEV